MKCHWFLFAWTVCAANDSSLHQTDHWYKLLHIAGYRFSVLCINILHLNRNRDVGWLKHCTVYVIYFHVLGTLIPENDCPWVDELKNIGKSWAITVIQLLTKPFRAQAMIHKESTPGWNSTWTQEIPPFTVIQIYIPLDRQKKKKYIYPPH